MDSYQETIKWMFSRLPMYQRKGAAAYRPGLESMEKLDRYLGEPHKTFKSIHIAGTAILELSEKDFNGKKVFYTKGTGWTSGAVKWFFKVEDRYESYFDKDTIQPYLFKRKINEGGYKKHRITSFNHKSNKAYVQDFTLQKDTSVVFSKVQDMLSAFYYLRKVLECNERLYLKVCLNKLRFVYLTQGFPAKTYVFR